MSRIVMAWCGCWCAFALSGCSREMPAEFAVSTGAAELSAELQSAVAQQLKERAGQFLFPKLIGETESAGPTELARGQSLYQERCVQCHGVAGDGAGPMAAYLYPRPRDYRRGVFKFTSTSYGGRPLREDLKRTLKVGVRGTSMPKFDLLPDKDLEALVSYVILLSRRGELEQMMIETAATEDELDPALVAEDLVPTLVQRWDAAIDDEVQPLTRQPKFTSAHVDRGRQAFLTKGCSKCHGDDGRGQTADNRGNDVWGQATRAADLTSGMLHGGGRPLDIYKRIYSGINGTPMPSFANALKDEPEVLWDLVAYVLHVSSRRRQGEIPPPGLMKPHLAPAAAAPAE